MAAEQFANLAATTLNGAINSAVTTVVVASGAAPFPSSAQFRIVVDSEIMLVTAGAGTASWTVTRGAESTTAASHADGAAVTHVLTAGALGVVSDPSAAVPGLRTLGSGATQAAGGTDSRLSDARTPTAHKTSHEPGGTDALTLLDNSSIKAAAGIVLSKLATDPLARANHTGTQTMSTISDAGSLATKSAIASADITDGTIVDADINGSAAIAATKISGTALIASNNLSDVTAATARTNLGLGSLATLSAVASAQITDGTIVGADLSGTIALPNGATATTQTAGDNSTKLATTAYVNANGPYMFGLRQYSNYPIPAAVSTSKMPNAGDGRFHTIVIAETGVLHDLSVLITATQATTNMNLMILDTGQANATHTTRTCLAFGTPTQVPATGAWFTFDPSLSVTAGQTLCVGVTIASPTTASLASTAGATGANVLPANFVTSSGAGTTSTKQAFTIASANMPAAVNNTVTDANCTTTQIAFPLYIWRIA